MLRNESIVYEGPTGTHFGAFINDSPHLFKDATRIVIRGHSFSVSSEKISPAKEVIIPKDYYLKHGYYLSARPEYLLPYLNKCMQSPWIIRASQPALKTYYFTGWACVEILDFIKEFNDTYSFAQFDIHRIYYNSIISSKRDYLMALDLVESDEEGDWCDIIIIINLKYPNRYIAKFLCVLLRTYFYRERYDRYLILGTPFQKTPIDNLIYVLNSNGPTSHYFTSNYVQKLRHAFEILEDWDFTDFQSALGSQTKIYNDIISEGMRISQMSKGLIRFSEGDL